MITVEFAVDEVEALLKLVGPCVSRWNLPSHEPLARAEFKLDVALLAHEERPL